MKIAPNNQFDISEIKLAEILNSYGLELVNYIEASTGIENRTIIVNTNRGKYVIRVYRSDKKTDQSVLAELDYTNYLRNHAIPVPNILDDISGQQLTRLVFDNQSWQIIVMDFHDGSHAKSYTDRLISQMATIQANMHILSGSYPTDSLPLEELTILRETYFTEQIKHKEITNTKLREFLYRAERYTLELSSDLPRGLCHLDYDKENLLSRNGAVLAVLDFDDLAVAPFIVCLAYTLCHIQTESGAAAVTQYLADYEATRKLSDLELEYLKPIMLFRHYMISALQVLNGHTSDREIDHYLILENELLRG